jgi:hypothetical protein
MSPAAFKDILTIVHLENDLTICTLHLKIYLARYGHPDTLAVDNVVEVVRFGPRFHLQKAHVPELETD